MPNDTFSFSIVIDNHNYGHFLRDAIESALGQTYSDTEVIVVDDGSTDDSVEVIRSYGDQVISLLKENEGQPSAFNAGYRISKGDAVCFLDADDWLLRDAVQKIVDAFGAPEVVKVHWPLWVVDAQAVVGGQTFPPDPMPDGDFRQLAIGEGPFYDSRFLPPTSGSAWRSSFLNQVMPIPDEGFCPTGAEVYLHAVVPIFGPMRSVREPLGYYRVHGGNHFWNRELSERKVEQYQRRFEACCLALSRRLQDQGIKADPARWKQRNFNYVWLSRLQQAREELRKITACGEACVLINDHEWGEGDPVSGSSVIYFHEREGAYWLPPNDTAAIAHLEHHRINGVRYMAFWWTSFWWLDEFPSFAQHLATSYQRVLDNDGLLVFDLRRRC